MTDTHLNIITCAIREVHTEPWWSVGASAECALIIITLLTIPEWIIGKESIAYLTGTLICRLTVVVVPNI